MASRPRQPSFRRGPTRAVDSRLEILAQHLRADASWRGRLQFNAFRARGEILNGHAAFEPVTDLHVLQTQEQLQRFGFVHASVGAVRDAMALVCAEASYHPICRWLEGLTWDQVNRLDHWLVDCMGCSDTAYVRAIGRMFVIAMVARVMNPGCQADYMLILEGSQGLYKSTICRVLAGADNFGHLSPKFDLDPVRTSMSLRGKWLLEVAELEAFSNDKTETLKAFVTQTVEDYTPKFGRHEVHEPRQCLLIGTTNRDRYLSDPTGGRRFWPVLTRQIRPDALAGMRDQLFAEAVHRYHSGERWWPDAAFEAQHIKPEQEERREIEPWVEIIEPWLKGQTSAKIKLSSVWKDCLFGRQSDYNPRVAQRLADAMRELGWERDHTDSTRPWVQRPIFSIP